ncbi:MAG TPA: FGGY family carbohydrate kinase [Patescibacteria group bacterium]|nr:FGGY family carbohydrate kinase [Patescibacteria group bacterium]
MNYLAGIDLGSTSLKCIIYDLAGNVVASGSRLTEQHHPDPNHPDWTVWQPEQIWGGTAAAMKEAVQQLDDPRHIKAVAVTGMGMDGVPIDEDGNWLYPFISWHDPRTEPQLGWWEENIGAEKSFRIGGNTLWRFSTALRLLWMAEHEPEILARTDKWLLIEDFLNFMLCGRQATDYTMASCTLLFDQNKRDWSDEILSESGIEQRLLCEAHPSGTLLGGVTQSAARATGLPEGTPVVLGGHDYLCGALPAGAFSPGVVLDVTGTWEIILAAIPAPILTSDVQKLGVTVETHVARDIYAVWGGAVASDMLEWYRKEYGFKAQRLAEQNGGVDWDYLMAEASASPAGARGILFLPHLSAAGCPVVDARSLGAFVGLSNFVQSGDMLRAIVEGLNYQVLDIVMALETGLGISPNRLVAVGGATRNQFLMQNKADITGLPIEVPELEEATTLGAAILAGIGIGLYQNEQDAFEQVYKPGKIYQPDPQLANKYARCYQIYKQLYPALAPVSHQLYEEFNV